MPPRPATTTAGAIPDPLLSSGASPSPSSGMTQRSWRATPARERSSDTVSRQADGGLRRSPTAIYLFELPDPLPLVTREQDTFEDLNAAGWTPSGLTNWRVLAASGTQVFRQTNTQGDARAIFDAFEGANRVR